MKRTEPVTAEEVRQIRAWVSYGFRPVDVSRWFNLNPSSVTRMRDRETWRHVED